MSSLCALVRSGMRSAVQCAIRSDDETGKAAVLTELLHSTVDATECVSDPMDTCNYGVCEDPVQRVLFAPRTPAAVPVERAQQVHMLRDSE